MKSIKVLYLTKIAEELKIQSRIEPLKSSAMLNMLVGAICSEGKIRPNGHVLLISCIANYYRHKAYSYIPMKRQVSHYILTDLEIRQSVIKIFNDNYITAINVRLLIKMALSSIADIILKSARQEQTAAN